MEAMKIEKTQTTQADQIAAKQTENAAALEKAQRLAETRADAMAGKDQATLSERARLLAKARAGLDEIPEVRSEKVDALRQQVEDGIYQIPIEQLVKRLYTHVV